MLINNLSPVTNKTALHLTHTCVETDSRILKEISCLVSSGYVVTGLGIVLEEGSSRSESAIDAEISSLFLYSRGFRFLPRTLRHIVSLLELTIRMLPRAIGCKPDVVHCHDTIVLPLGVAVKLFTKAKLIYDAHELESNRNGLTRAQAFLTLSLEKFLWRFVDAQIVVSPSIQAWYQSNIGPKPSSIILNSPVFRPQSQAHNDYLRRKFLIPRNKLIFIYVGIFGPGRGLEMLAQSFMRADISAHVVFMGYGELGDALRNLERKHVNIHVHDAVPHEQVVPIVASADYGLCLIEEISLSDYYSLPNKLFEYCFAGIPVLASAFPDIKQLIDEYCMGMCCDLSVEAVVTAIKQLEIKTEKARFKNLGPLSWQAQELKILATYHSLFEAS
jgi:glycosyltransferase involved in cell wall biosynthesis